MRPVTLAGAYTLADFDALLASGEFAYAEAIKVTLASGTILSYTNAQQLFTVPQCDGAMGLRTYVADDVQVSGFKSRISNGCESNGGSPTVSITVDEMSLTFTPDQNLAMPSIIDGVPFIQALRRRAFDGAVIERDTWYFRGPNLDPIGGMPRFYGYAAGIDSAGRTQAVVKVKADPVLLDAQMPRNLYQPNCQYTLYSAGCGADRSAFALNGFVGASPSTSFIPCTSATAQFTGGYLQITSGAAIGQTRSIARADTTGFWLSYPLYDLPLLNDHFTAYPGCNRLDPLVNPSTSGCTFFGRQSAFRATPNVPGAVYGI